jgi:Protein of unknown function (DUF3788)
MQQNVFAGRAKQPTERALSSALGETLELWKRLVGDLRREWHLGASWNTSSIKLGWSLRLQLDARNIVYLGPRSGFFVAAFVLGDRALAAARAGNLQGRVLKLIAEAKRYAEGTAVRIAVRKPEDLDIVKTLVKIKLEN